jgi:hypothetical protein
MLTTSFASCPNNVFICQDNYDRPLGLANQAARFFGVSSRTSVTFLPSRLRYFTRISILNLLMRPVVKSEILGCFTPKTLAA